ncbi:hypothetical protein C4X99_15565 [Leptospira interrogans serovar Geyaweera]|nr:hypothetical protein C5473_06935 [Leptospira interrogans serovar Weerasinghe]KAA1292416.1 hypothetical protein C4X99_15565 [Leptospira interrogans serovar Geyaweera]QCO38084.1 hypothetical protein E4412_13425 [Leptospira interrogans]
MFSHSGYTISKHHHRISKIVIRIKLFFQHGTRIKKSILKSNQNKKLNFVKRLVNLQIVNYGYKVV